MKPLKQAVLVKPLWPRREEESNCDLTPKWASSASIPQSEETAPVNRAPALTRWWLSEGIGISLVERDGDQVKWCRAYSCRCFSMTNSATVHTTTCNEQRCLNTIFLTTNQSTKFIINIEYSSSLFVLSKNSHKIDNYRHIWRDHPKHVINSCKVKYDHQDRCNSWNRCTSSITPAHM